MRKLIWRLSFYDCYGYLHYLDNVFVRESRRLQHSTVHEISCKTFSAHDRSDPIWKHVHEAKSFIYRYFPSLHSNCYDIYDRCSLSSVIERWLVIINGPFFSPEHSVPGGGGG